MTTEAVSPPMTRTESPGCCKVVRSMPWKGGQITLAMGEGEIVALAAAGGSAVWADAQNHFPSGSAASKVLP